LIAETRHGGSLGRGSEHTYRPAWWVPGGHTQTLWAKFFRRRQPLHARKQRWTTPDGDFVDVYRTDADARAPRLLLLHGLEGTVRSHYVTGFFREAAQRGWGADLLIFRGCGDELNAAPRLYHSGETSDLAFIVERIREQYPSAPLVLAGVSLGGNVLLKFLGEAGAGACDYVAAAAAVSVPFDLERGARFIGRGFSSIYDRHFLRSLRRKALDKLVQHPGLFDRDALMRARNIYEFDDAVTAPVHGFVDAHDYYTRSSSIRYLDRIRVPTLLLSAVDDPFLPSEVLDEVRLIASTNAMLHLEFTAHGGHVGFVGGQVPWKPFYYAEWRACQFLASRLDAFHSNPLPSVP
jgi:predicted alpha/beta-fold hydrolase